MSRLSEIYDYIDSFAPFSLQLEWDNSGILVNCGNCVISKALVTLDITAEVLNEAIDGKYDLIVSHHPVIFGSLSALTEKHRQQFALKTVYLLFPPTLTMIYLPLV